jgi:hypothetical protein
MWRCRTAWRALLFLAAAVLSAVISDWVIETAANVGLYGPAFADHDQRSLLATSTAGAMLALAAVIVVLVERCRSRRGGGAPRDWLAETAHDIAARWSWRAFPSTLAVAIVVRYAMESAELLRTTGHVATGLGWLGGPLLIALLLHAAFCALTLLALLTAMRGLARAFDAVLAFVTLLVAIVLSVRPASSHFTPRARRRPFVLRRSPLATRLGERAPPLSVLA